MACGATREEPFKQRGPSRIDEDRTKVDAVLVATATEQVLSACSSADGRSKVEGLGLLGVTDPPVTSGDGGHVERIAAETVVETDHTCKRTRGLDLDLARSWSSTGDDFRKSTVVSEGKATQAIAIRTKINRIARDVLIVRKAEHTTRHDIDVARAEGCSSSTDGRSNGA